MYALECKCVDCMNFAGSQKLIDKRRKIKDQRGAELAMKVAQDAWKAPQNSARSRRHMVRSCRSILLLPGLLKNYYRGYSWLCFVLLVYFVFAVQGSLMSTAGLLDHIFLFLTVILFIVAMMTSRRSVLSEAQPKGHCDSVPPRTKATISNVTSGTCMPRSCAKTGPRDQKAPSAVPTSKHPKAPAGDILNR